MKKYSIILFFALGLILSGCSHSTGSDDEDPDPVNGNGIGEFSITFGGDWSGSENFSFSAFTIFDDEDEPGVENFVLFASSTNIIDEDVEDVDEVYTIHFGTIGGMISSGTYDIVDGLIADEEDNLSDAIDPGEFVVYLFRLGEQVGDIGYSQTGSITFDSVTQNAVSGTFAIEFQVFSYTTEPVILDVTATGSFSSPFREAEVIPD
jgi:hypothetical protein